MSQNDYFEQQIGRKQHDRRAVQAEHIKACAEKWRHNPSRANLQLMQHVMERIHHDESLIYRREWNLKDGLEE